MTIEQAQKKFISDTLKHRKMVKEFMIYYAERNKVKLAEDEKTLKKDKGSNFIKAVKERGSLHDNSKLSGIELDNYTKLVMKGPRPEFGTPEYDEFLDQIKPTIALHVNNNKHHPEFWNGDIDLMDNITFIEMCADFLASSLRDSTGIEKSIRLVVERYNFTAEQKARIKDTMDDMYTLYIFENALGV